MSKFAKEIKEIKEGRSTSLELANAKLKTLPNELLQQPLDQLMRLDLSNNSISAVPSTLNVKNLKWVDLSNNSLTSIAPEFLRHPKLKFIDLSRNKLEGILDFSKMDALEELDLSYNKLKSCPFITSDSSLTVIDLSHNEIGVLSSADCKNLASIEELNLSYNKLKELPGEFACLLDLLRFDISHNHLRSIPEQIRHLKNLIELQATNNQLVELPFGILALKNIKEIKVNDNPKLRFPPPDVYKEGAQAIIRFLQSKYSPTFAEDAIEEEKKPKRLESALMRTLRNYPINADIHAMLDLSDIQSALSTNTVAKVTTNLNNIATPAAPHNTLISSQHVSHQRVAASPRPEREQKPFISQQHAAPMTPISPQRERPPVIVSGKNMTPISSPIGQRRASTSFTTTPVPPIRGRSNSTTTPLAGPGQGPSRSAPEISKASEQQDDSSPEEGRERGEKNLRVKKKTPSTRLIVAANSDLFCGPEKMNIPQRKRPDMFLQHPNFWLEATRSDVTIQDAISGPFILEEARDLVSFYRDNFFETAHFNFIGKLAGSDTPVVISVKTEKDKDANYLGLVRLPSGDKKVYIPEKELKDMKRPRANRLLKKVKEHCSAAADAEVKRISDRDFDQTLCYLEQRLMVAGFKIGILYATEKQTREEDMFSNNTMSKDFLEFLSFLGSTIDLKGWGGYAGGLNVKETEEEGAGTTGVKSVYTKWRPSDKEKEMEIMFHVSTMLAYQINDKQKVERKRHLGNDIIVIIFQEGETPISPATVTSEYNQVYVLVRAEKDELGETYYRISFASKTGVPEYSPPLPAPNIFPKNEASRNYFLTKLINAERASYRAPVFSTKIAKTRKLFLTSLLDDFE